MTGYGYLLIYPITGIKAKTQSHNFDEIFQGMAEKYVIVKCWSGYYQLLS